MTIDWTTFGLEIINFLALVWILKRFLYRPILDTLARRRAAAQQVLAQARATEEQAQALQAKYEGRLADWEHERAATRERFDADLAAERSRRMDELTQELAQARKRQGAIDAREQLAQQRQREQEALALARRFTRTVLARLASPALEARMIDLLIEDWNGLPGEKLAALRTAPGEPARVATLTSAFVLSDDQRQRLSDALRQRLEQAVDLRFAEDPALLAGVRFSLGSWQFHLNLADELAAFGAASGHAA